MKVYIVIKNAVIDGTYYPMEVSTAFVNEKEAEDYYNQQVVEATQEAKDNYLDDIMNDGKTSFYAYAYDDAVDNFIDIQLRTIDLKGTLDFTNI